MFARVCGLQAMRDSEVVEVSADRLWLRTQHNPERWAIEGTAPNTFLSLKVDVPEFVPGQIYVNVQETGEMLWAVLLMERMSYYYYYYKCQDLSDAITTVAGALYKVYQYCHI